MTTELVFADPPDTKTHNREVEVSKWRDRLTAAAEHPGQWIDATATWGAHQLAKNCPMWDAADELGVAVEVRRVGQGGTQAYLRVIE